jgi:hypothetical protein
LAQTLACFRPGLRLPFGERGHASHCESIPARLGPAPCLLDSEVITLALSQERSGEPREDHVFRLHHARCCLTNKTSKSGLGKTVSMRIQRESGRLTNMSMATLAKSGQLALQTALSGLAHATCSQDRLRVFCPSHGFTGRCQGIWQSAVAAHTYLGQTARLMLNPHSTTYIPCRFSLLVADVSTPLDAPLKRLLLYVVYVVECHACRTHSPPVFSSVGSRFPSFF